MLLAAAAAAVPGVPVARAQASGALRRGEDPAEGDRILVVDFIAPGGDATMGLAAAAACEVALAASPRLEVFARERLPVALERLGVQTDGIDAPTGRRLALQEGLRLVIAGELRPRGAALQIEVSAIEPTSGRIHAGARATARSREGLHDALEQLAEALRGRLGEAHPERDPIGAPLRLATSPSLDALALYARAGRIAPGGGARAEEALRRAIELDPEFASAMVALAMRRWRRSSAAGVGEAVALLARAQGLAHRLPARRRLWLQVAADEIGGRIDEAMAGARAYLVRYPRDAGAWFRLGWMAMAGDRSLDAAVAAFERVISLDPGNAGAWSNLATCLKALRRHEEAVVVYRRAFALVPSLLLAEHLNGEYGSTLVQLGRLDEAQAAFVAMQGAPSVRRRARGMRSMALLRMRQGRYREATAELARAIVLNTDAGSADAGSGLSALRDHVFRAHAWVSLGAGADALREVERIQARAGRLELAPEWLAKLVRLHARRGARAEIARLVTLIAQRVGVAGTESSLGRNLALDAGWLDVARAELALADGDAAAAVAFAAAAAQRLAQEELVLAPRARALQAAGRLDEAAAAWQRLAEIAPFGYEEQEDLPAAWIALAGLHERGGRRAEALAAWRALAAMWQGADAELPALALLRERMRALGG